MTTSKLVRNAARLLAGATREEPEVPSVESRAQAVTAIELALRARARAATRRRWMVGLAVAAGAAMLVFAGGLLLRRGHGGESRPEGQHGPVAVVAHPSGEGTLVVGAGQREPLAEGRLLSAGSRVVTTPQGSVVLALSTGTSITIDAGSDVAVVQSGAQQRFSLRGGTLHADVARLQAGERFSIATPDAEIEVHGTAFSVQVVGPAAACADGTRTRVVVRHGVVTVRHDGATARLTAGDRWPADCEVPAVAGVAPAEPDVAPLPGAPERPVRGGVGAPRERATVAEPAIVPPRPAPAEPVAPAPAPPGVGVSVAPMPAPVTPEREAPARAVPSLAEQNDAFAVAMGQLRRGDRAGALAAFDRFLSHYPGGPLSESASIERMRILARIDQARAREAARRYLRAYPFGSARHEAQTIVGPDR